MHFIETIVNTVNTVLWDYALLFLLCGTGIFFTFRLKFVQIRKFGEGMKRVFSCFNLKGEKADKGGMSSFQALTTAIAAQVGTGNIAGASTAIASGGPGAIFWMWMSAFFGMATIYAEAILAQKYKQVDENGNVYAAKTGSATITVTITDEYGNKVTDTCDVNVQYTWWQWIIVIVLFGWIWY